MIPARSKPTVGVLVEPNIFERPKVVMGNKPKFEDVSFTSSINLTDDVVELSGSYNTGVEASSFDAYTGEILINSIDNVKIDAICQWITECIISGYSIEVFNKIIIHSSILIHINNPTLPTFICSKLLEFTKLISKYNSKDKNYNILLRNDQSIRHI